MGNSKIISQSKKLGLTELPRYPNVNSYTLILFIQTPKLVGGIPTTLKNMSLSVVMMKFPIYGKIKNVPNHQPEKRTPKPLKKRRQIPIWIRHCWYISHSKAKRNHRKKNKALLHSPVGPCHSLRMSPYFMAQNLPQILMCLGIPRSVSIIPWFVWTIIH